MIFTKKELKNIKKLTDSLKDSNKDILLTLIKDESEAINSYGRAITQTNNAELKRIFTRLQKEEIEHHSELLTLLKGTYDSIKDSTMEINEGKYGDKIYTLVARSGLRYDESDSGDKFIVKGSKSDLNFLKKEIIKKKYADEFDFDIY